MKINIYCKTCQWHSHLITLCSKSMLSQNAWNNRWLREHPLKELIIFTRASKMSFKFFDKIFATNETSKMWHEPQRIPFLGCLWIQTDFWAPSNQMEPMTFIFNPYFKIIIYNVKYIQYFCSSLQWFTK